MLDLTSVVMGPMATQILGDLGADVITVESARGDTNRYMGPGPLKGLSDISLNLLRNKRNVAIDLKHPDGRAALLQVVRGCDVFVTNLRPGPLARLGLTYQDVAAARADVVYCRAHGFPSDSGRADEPAYDDIIQAAGGIPDILSRAGGEPALLPILLADKVCGLYIAQAVLAGLYHRSRTGEGQEIEVPMLDALRAFLLVEHSSGATSGSSGQGTGYRRILTNHRRPQRTKDGWIAVFPYLPAHWEALFGAAGIDFDPGDERLTLRGRQADPAFGYGVLERTLSARRTDEWLSLCAAAGIPAAESADLDDLVGALPDAEHPRAGRYKLVPPPVRYGATPAAVRRPAPMAGEHTAEVLAEAGLTPEQIDALERSGALGRRRPSAHTTPS